MTDAVLTIGMPVFNGAPWLHRTATALLHQTFEQFVLVICDNASTDDTREICEGLAKADRRVSYIRNPEDIGVFGNYDRVFSYANTKYFKWASVNDFCAPEFVEECVQALDRHSDAVLVYPRTVIFQDDPETGELYDADLNLAEACPVERFRRLLNEIRLNNMFNGVIRTDILKKTSLNKPYQGSDIGLLAELALRGKMLRLAEPLFYRHVTPDTLSAMKSRKEQQEFFASVGRDVMSTPTWDLYMSCFRAVMKAPISVRQRTRCTFFLSQLCWWGRYELWHEATRKLPEQTTA